MSKDETRKIECVGGPADGDNAEVSLASYPFFGPSTVPSRIQQTGHAYEYDKSTDTYQHKGRVTP